MLTTTLRLSLVLAFAAVLTLAGLSRPRVADAQTTTTTTHETFQIASTTFVPCANGGAGEFVELTGETHILFHSTSNDNHGASRSHSHPVGLTGVGLTTGDIYRSVSASGFTVSFQTDGSTSVLTSTSNFRLVGPGPDNDLVGRQVFHFTIVDGEMTSFQNNNTFDCK